MTPKLLALDHFNPSERIRTKQPLPEVKRMTLVSAMIAPHCGAMFADSQETVTGYAKKSVDKLQYDPTGNGYFRFALGGASDSGPYIDMFNFELSGVLASVKSVGIGDICEAVEEFAVKFHDRHIWLQKNGPRLETVVMVQPVDVGRSGFHAVDLIHICQTAVIPLINSHAKAIGIGSYLADYIAEKLIGDNCAENETHLFAAAVYILQQVKLHVDGVGLKGKIVMFNADGSLGEYDQDDIEPFEKVMGEFDDASRQIFRLVGESRETNEKLNAVVEELRHIQAKYANAWRNIESRRMAALDQYSNRLKRLGN